MNENNYPNFNNDSNSNEPNHSTPNYQPEQQQSNPPGYFTMRDVTPTESGAQASQTPQQPTSGYQPPQQPGSGYRPIGDGGYQPPHQSSGYQPQSDVGYQTPPQQYSTSTGWQAPAADGAQAAAVKPYRKNKGLKIFGITLISVFSVVVLAFAGIGVMNVIAPGTPADEPPSSDTALNVPVENLPGISLQNRPENDAVQLPNGRLSTEQVVEKVEPSVVAITTYMNVSNYQATGMGSGIVITEDGYIVTNAHVVEGAQGITVQMSDDNAYEGRLIASDSKTDLAVIKVDATGLIPAAFGNSEQIKVGEKVIAIGNPQSMEFYGSVTQGIVSGLNRKITAADANTGSQTTYSNLIQTDAAINPGNSGGALVNEYGQVIGINSAKVVASGAEGMGFAIPASEVKPIVDDLIAHGYVTGRVRLGITAEPVNEALARMNNVPPGVRVRVTEEGSDISRQGVIPGDIITKIDGVEIDGFEKLTEQLKGKKPGDTVRLTIYRAASRSSVGSRTFDVSVELMEDKGQTGTVVQPQQDNTQRLPDNSQQYPNGGSSYPDNLDDLFDLFG